jgi:hypothetical protein
MGPEADMLPIALRIIEVCASVVTAFSLLVLAIREFSKKD